MTLVGAAEGVIDSAKNRLAAVPAVAEGWWNAKGLGTRQGSRHVRRQILFEAVGSGVGPNQGILSSKMEIGGPLCQALPCGEMWRGCNEYVLSKDDRPTQYSTRCAHWSSTPAIDARVGTFARGLCGK